MDLFLTHCLVLIWTSVGAARRLTRQTADQILMAAMLAWGNLVGTCLLLSSLHRLGDPAWFMGVSLSFALLILLLTIKVRPEPAPEPAGSKLNPWLLGLFFLTIAPLAYAGIGIAYTYQPNNNDSLTYQLPRAMYYLGQNTLGHFEAGDARQIYFPFNFNLLQLFGLVYSPPLQCLNFFNLAAWVVGGLAVFRLCRLCALSGNVSLVATWLAITSNQLLAQATTSTNDLLAAAALLCALVFALRWRVTGRMSAALLAGLAAGLSLGSNLTIWYFIPAAGLLLALWTFRFRQRAETTGQVNGARAWILPGLLAFAVGAPFALINLVERRPWLGRVFEPAPSAPPFMSAGLTDDQLWFGFAGPFFLGCAVVGLVRDRRLRDPASWFAWLGLGWMATWLLLHRRPLEQPQPFVPVMLIATPCVAALMEVIRRSRLLLRSVGYLILLGLAVTAEWSAGTYLLQNPSRPFAPILSHGLVPPSLPSVPLAMEHRLASEPRINIDTDGVNEPIFLIMASGQSQRFTASERIDPGVYNILSRSGLSRNAAFRNLDQFSSHLFVPIRAKRTAGVEFLATIGDGASARDYFGVGSRTSPIAPLESNRVLLVTVYHDPRQQGSETKTRIKVAGLNPEDQVLLVVEMENIDGSASRLTSFTKDDEATLSITRPFRWLKFRALDATTGAEIGIGGIPYLSHVAEKPLPVVSTQPTSVNSLFVTDVVLSKPPAMVAAEGLTPTEGPFPFLDIPYIRWARQPAVRVKIPPIYDLTSLQISFSVRLQVRSGADLEVLFNGKLVQHYRIDSRTAWLDQTLELTPQPGSNVLEFRDATFKTKPDWLDYLKRYPDVKDYLQAQKIPLEEGARQHYEAKGRAEGRTVQILVTEEPEAVPDSFYFMYRNIRLEGFKKP